MADATQQQPDREPPHCSTPIDVRAAGADGHWDHADIRALCEYRDQLLAEIVRLRTENEQLRFAAQTNLGTIQAMQRLGVVQK